jgi:hypothetical protein
MMDKDKDTSIGMVDVGIVSVNGSMGRDGDYIKGAIFSDGASRGIWASVL